MQGRREEETGAYWEVSGGTRHSRGIAVVREDFRRPRICPAPQVQNVINFLADREATQQMNFFSSLLGYTPGRGQALKRRTSAGRERHAVTDQHGVIVVPRIQQHPQTHQGLDRIRKLLVG